MSTRRSSLAASAGLVASLVAATIAPRAARADQVKFDVIAMLQDAAMVFGADGAVPNKPSADKCLADYDTFIKDGGTDAYPFKYPKPIRTRTGTWAAKEPHTVADVKALCHAAAAALGTYDLVEPLASRARSVFQSGKRADPGAVKGCLAAYDKAHAAGVPDSATVEIKTMRPDDRLQNGTYTIVQLRDFCAKAQADTAAGDALDDARNKMVGTIGFEMQTLLRAQTTTAGDLQTNIKDLDGDAEHCSQAVADALAAGVKPDTVVKVDGGLGATWSGPVSKLTTEVCPRFAAELKKQQDAYDQMVAEFKKHLKGDKLRMALEILPDGYWLSASSGSVHEPAQLGAHDVWFEILERDPGDDDHCNQDKVYVYTRYQFDRGGKLVKQSAQTYCGDPGAKAYR